MGIPVRVLTYSPMPLSLAAWWKKAAQMHFRTTSQSEPQLTSLIFCCSMISLSCARTSRTLRIALLWMKCSLHHWPEYPFVFHCWYTFRKVRWSDSGT